MPRSGFARGSNRANQNRNGECPMTTEADIRAIALARGVREVAVPDVLLQFPDDGVVSVSEWLAEMKPERPHWFAPPAGAETTALTDLTAQGAFVRQVGAERASEVLAKHGLKLGQIRAPTAEKPGEVKGENNPYSANFKGTDEKRQ